MRITKAGTRFFFKEDKFNTDITFCKLKFSTIFFCAKIGVGGGGGGGP